MVTPRGETPSSTAEGPRIGYVGLDHHHATPYLRTLETLPGTVCCACEPNDDFDAVGVKGLSDVPVYRDPAAMLEEVALDAVFVTLPNRETPGVIERALRADVDVFTEKPAGRTAADLEPLRELEGRSAGTVCISYPWTAHPVALDLADRVSSGFFGDLRGFEARFVASQLAYRDPDHYLYDVDASRGGILQWLGIHWIQLLSSLLPSPIARVNCRMVAGTDGVAVEDGATVQLETEDGTIGTVHCGYYLREGVYDTSVALYGTGGHARWDPMGRTFGFDDETTLELDSTSEEWASAPRRTVTYDYEFAPGYGGSWGRRFVKGFFEACETGVTPPVALENAIAVLEVVDAAYASAETGEWTTVGE